MIIKDEQKVVDYFGMRLTVPIGRGFLATDRNSHVWWYEREPLRMIYSDRSWFTRKGYFSVFLCTAHLDGMDWRDTLMEV